MGRTGLNIQELSKLDFEPRHNWQHQTNSTIEITRRPQGEEIQLTIEQTIGQFEGAVEI